MQHDSHVRTWRLWNEFLMRPEVMAEMFREWKGRVLAYKDVGWKY